MNLIGKYRNGNYDVEIYDDGTKIRSTDAYAFIPEFPENIDIKITNQCNMGCPMCHENSTPDGNHGDILNAAFIETLHPYTELAIGGGNPLAHPDLQAFLEKLKSQNIIANITVNQTHFEANQTLIKQLVDDKLVYGIGVSLVNPTPEFIALMKQYDNAVIHVINGVLKASDIKRLANQDLKMLILGYKQFRRGKDYYDSENRDKLEYNMKGLSKTLTAIIPMFKVVSFDNLAIEQLNVRSLMSEKKWREFYMGDDGNFTMYIDMVNKQFARNSTATTRYELCNDIDSMFCTIKHKHM